MAGSLKKKNKNKNKQTQTQEPLLLLLLLLLPPTLSHHPPTNTIIRTPLINPLTEGLQTDELSIFSYSTLSTYEHYRII